MAKMDHSGISDEAPLQIALSTTLFSLEAIKKAGYRMLDEATFAFQPGEKDEIRVTLTPVGEDSPQRREQILCRFNRELHDQDLREIIAKESEPLRNLLLAHTFSGLTAETDK